MKSYPAIRLNHPLGEFYLTAIPADILLGVCFSRRHSRHDATASGWVHDEGHQRRLDQRRLDDISRYLQTQDAVLPGTIILAGNCTQDGKILDPQNPDENEKRWNIGAVDNETKNDIVCLNIPTEEKLAAVVDGQHRLWGFVDVTKELQKTPLPCAVFLDLPTPQQAAIFATINFNQKPVSKSQSYELFGYNLDEEQEKSWSPDKLSVFFARKLNVDIESPFKDHIKVAAQDDRILDEIAKNRHKEWAVSTATIVEGILSLISKNPKQDRDALHRDPVESRSRKKISNLQTRGIPPPFRELYLAEDRDIVMYKTLINFFNVANETYWKKLTHERKDLIRKTAGIQALFNVLKELLPRQLEMKDLQESTWKTILEKSQIIDFANPVFESSGRGRKRIQDAILVTIERKALTDITDGDLCTYLKTIIKETPSHA